MKPCKKTFLILVGLVTMTFDQVNSAINEAVVAVDKQIKKEKSEPKNE